MLKLESLKLFGLAMVIAFQISQCLHAEEKSTQKKSILQSGDRVVFLGDSNTYAATYIDMLDCYLRVNHPDLKLDLINVGLPSETCSGLSEPDHPYPRPDVHERLDRVLERTKPDVVFICYGMNDGIYHPFSEERFAAYKAGIAKLIKKIKAIDAKIVLLTPPPFDPLPMRKSGKLRKVDSKQFAWFAIYEDYDEVLKKYSDWIMKSADDVELKIDLHTPFSKQVAEKRKSEPDYTMSGDGVHFNADGHLIIAHIIASQLGLEKALVHKQLFDLVSKRQHLLRDAWITHCEHKRPNTRKGKPLDEAKVEAQELEKQIRGMLNNRG